MLSLKYMLKKLQCIVARDLPSKTKKKVSRDLSSSRRKLISLSRKFGLLSMYCLMNEKSSSIEIIIYYLLTTPFPMKLYPNLRVIRTKTRAGPYEQLDWQFSMKLVVIFSKLFAIQPQQHPLNPTHSKKSNKPLTGKVKQKHVTKVIRLLLL